MDLNFTDREAIEMAEEDYKGLPDTVKEFLSNRILIQMLDTLIEIEDCESPIEQLFGAAMLEFFPKTIGVIAEDHFINCQEIIECEDKKYRVDFFVVTKYKGEVKGFVIECDGHDFHERTKEQAKKDKKKDRQLWAKGHPVIRFTGSEIFDNPIVCAREAANIITNNLLSGD